MSNLIYVHLAGQIDRARWLQLDVRPDGQVMLMLQDLCHPGRLSQLRSVTCPVEFMRIALDRGTLQITSPTGYLLLRPDHEYLNLEFRGLDDVGTTKVSVLREDVQARLNALLADQSQASVR